MIDDYTKALEAHNVAVRKFRKVQEAYRARLIDTDAYLAGRKQFDAATVVFDEAFAKERDAA